MKNVGQGPVSIKHSANTPLEVGLVGALWPFLVYRMTLKAYQARPGTALVGKARTTVGFGLGFWSGGTIPEERGYIFSS